MCGITGFYSKTNSNFSNLIYKMNSAISHRGPDSEGIWQNKDLGICFGHRRLSILDLSNEGHQPMLSGSGQFVITYNGEIYNHLEIRRELEQSNIHLKWRGNSDTETLVEAIDFWGIEKALNKIVGMFAFGLWDQKKNKLILARDRMGEKPLYYGWQGNGSNNVFLFGSELKALKAHPDFEKNINRDVIALQLKYNYIPAPYSIYKNIYKLLPGHYLELNEKDLKSNLLPKSKDYWSLKQVANLGINNQNQANIKNLKDELENLLRKTINQQMISDVPLGAFLSGGIDSSTIVALMQTQSSNKIKTFTIGFSEESYNEAPYAKNIANHLGTDHTEMYVSDKQVMDVIPKLGNIYDEPYSDSSQIPTFLVSELAKEKVSVSLSGDGGDELFCGYNRYVMSKKWWSKICFMPLSLRVFLADKIMKISQERWNIISKTLMRSSYKGNLGDLMYKFLRVLKCKSLNEVYLKLTSHFDNPTEIVIESKTKDNILSNYRLELNQFDDQQKMMIFDALTYLPDDILVKLDRAAMASSLETRAPFLDHRIVEYSWKIPQSFKIQNGQGKWILRQILHKYVPKKLIERPKKGFAIPLDSWLRGPLREWAENLLNKKKLSEEGYFNSEMVIKMWQDHLSNKRNYQHKLWNILMVQAWLDF